MTVCSNRTDNPGFFTGCAFARIDRCCACSLDAADPDHERLAALITEGLTQVEASHQLWTPR